METPGTPNSPPAAPGQTASGIEQASFQSALVRAEPDPESSDEVHPSGRAQRLQPIPDGPGAGVSLRPVEAEPPTAPAAALPSLPTEQQSETPRKVPEPAPACLYDKEPSAVPAVVTGVKEPNGAAATALPEHPSARFAGSIESERASAAAATAPAERPASAGAAPRRTCPAQPAVRSWVRRPSRKKPRQKRWRCPPSCPGSRPPTRRMWPLKHLRAQPPSCAW